MWMPGVCSTGMVNAVLDLTEPDPQVDPFAWRAVCPFDETHVVTVKATLPGYVHLCCHGGCSPHALCEHIELACQQDEVRAA
jgi:hypothetical protein